MKRCYELLIAVSFAFTLASCGGSSSGNSLIPQTPSSTNDPDNEDDPVVVPSPSPVDVTNQAPQANDDFATIPEDGALEGFNAISNDADPEGASLTVASVDVSSELGLVELQNGLIYYIPPENFYGSAEIDVVITDGELQSRSSLIVTVSSVNDLPITRDDYYTINENDENVQFPVLENDIDIETASLSLGQVQASFGSVEIVGDQIIYSPASGFTGLDLITYQALDDNGGGVDAVVSVDVTPSEGNSLTLNWLNPPARIDGRVLEDTEVNSYLIEYRNIQTEERFAFEIDRAETNELALVDGSIETSFVVTGLDSGYFEFNVQVKDVAGQLSNALQTIPVRVGS